MEKETALLSAWIDEAKVITAVSHARPDGDAAGCCAAMVSYLAASRGKDAAAILPDFPPVNVGFVFDPSQPLTEPAAVAARLARTDLLICLDFNTLSRTEGLEGLLRGCKCRKVLIDHHEEPALAEFDLAFSNTKVSSACELLYEVLKRMPDVDGDAAKLPAAAARALMTGMTTDTNNFANSVFPGTLQMASELLAAGVDRDFILDKIYFSERSNRLYAMGEMLSERMRILPEGAAVIVLPQQFFDRHGLQDGETEGFVNMPLAIRDVRLSILAREDGDWFRVSIRSKRGVSARMLAKTRFHGGGHEQASGGKVFIPQDVQDAVSVERYIMETTARFMQEQDAVKTGK